MDECSSLATHAFVGLPANMNSTLLPNGKSKFTAKGFLHRYILKHLNRKDYLHRLKGTKSTVATFSTIRSLKQQIKTFELTKKCLRYFDDKRYIHADGIATDIIRSPNEIDIVSHWV